MSTLCCSNICEKRTECKKHSMNNEGIHYVEDFYYFGSGSIGVDGIKESWWCGKLGDYKMFEPIEKSCAGCVYEDADGSTSAISNCVCCSRNVGFAKNDNYKKKTRR